MGVYECVWVYVIVMSVLEFIIMYLSVFWVYVSVLNVNFMSVFERIWMNLSVFECMWVYVTIWVYLSECKN